MKSFVILVHFEPTFNRCSAARLRWDFRCKQEQLCDLNHFYVPVLQQRAAAPLFQASPP